MHHLGQMNYADGHYFLLFLSPFFSPLRTHVSSHALSARHLPTLHVQNVKKISTALKSAEEMITLFIGEAVDVLRDHMHTINLREHLRVLPSVYLTL